MKQVGTATLPSAAGSSGKGRFRRKRIVRGRQLVGRLQQGGAQPVPRRPAPDGGDAVPRQDPLPVMPEQAVAQLEVPAAAVVLDLVALQHLRRWLQPRVGAIQRVEHHQPVGARHLGGGGEDRVGEGEVDHRHEAQGGRGRRPRDGGPGQCRRDAGGQQGAAAQGQHRRACSARGWSGGAGDIGPDLARPPIIMPFASCEPGVNPGRRTRMQPCPLLGRRQSTTSRRPGPCRCEIVDHGVPPRRACWGRDAGRGVRGSQAQT